MRARVKPSRERGPVDEDPTLSREIDEDLLRHVFGQMSVAADASQRDRVNKPEVALHQRGECGLGTLLNVASQQFSIGDHDGIRMGLPPMRKPDDLFYPNRCNSFH